MDQRHTKAGSHGAWWLLLMAVGIFMLLTALPAGAKGVESERGRSSVRGGNASTTGTAHHDDNDTSEDLHEHGPIQGREHHDDNLTTLPETARFEIVWLKTNIILHNRMIKIAAAENAATTSTQLKTFSADLQTSLGAELTQMQGWLLTCYGIDGTTTTLGCGDDHEGLGEDDDDSFVLTPGDGDLKFLRRVISYERSEVQLGRMAVQRGTHPELVAFGTALIAEGQSILTLVTAWYDLLIQMDLGHDLPGDGDDDGGLHGGLGTGQGGGHGGHGGDD